MDSDHSAEKSRRRSRRVPQNLKLDTFGLNFEDQENLLSPSSRFETKKSSPDPEVNLRHWTVVSEGFPPGVTVDELKNYGRRRQLSHLRPQDNLRLEGGSLKAYKSEYRRRYQAHAPSNLPQPNQETVEVKEGSKEQLEPLPEYRVSYVNCVRERPVLKRPQNNIFLLKEQPMESATEKNSKYILFPHYERRKLLRRSTALKPEGEMTNETEVRKQFKCYLNPERAQIVRRLPSLKLEGEFEPMTTEQRDKFIAYLLSRRPILEKKKTSLRMEGDFYFDTEKKLSYVRHDPSERPLIRKRSTSLKLDGEVEFFPEYKNSFVDFPRTRPITYKPNGNLRYEGELEKETETKTQFVGFDKVSIPESAKPENNLHVEGEMEIRPEYKINFVDFPRERPFLRRPMNQLKPEGNLQVLTESSERFSDVIPVEKSESLRRPSNLKLEGNFDFLSENTDKFRKPEPPSDKTETPKLNSNLKLEGEIDFVTEKSEKFGFPVTEREPTLRRPSSLKLEGDFLLVPEYRKSFVDFRKPGNVLKPIQDTKSNPGSPRKKQKEKIKSNLEEEKKSISGTPRRRPNAKRLKESGSQPEKSLKFEVPESNDKSEKDCGENEVSQMGKAKSVDDLLLGNSKMEASTKDFPAFQVLDVKGQLGCQSLRKDILESEKSTSDEDNPTYRLEVFNGGERGSPGFHRNHLRIFPESGLDPERLEEAERRARQRADTFVKVVKSPGLPNYLVEENNNEVLENRWKTSGGRISPVSLSNDLEKRSFVVLDNGPVFDRDLSQTSKDETKRERGERWDTPDWMNSLPAA